MRSIKLIKPENFPFFYGYVIALVGTIGIWASIPGQTAGVSTFTDPVKDALVLSRNQFSLAYMIGTLLSSLVLTKAGKFYDRYGATITASSSIIILTITLLLCSFSTNISEYIKFTTNQNHWLIPFTVMVILFFMLRFSGQGVLTMASRNMIMKWFDRKRGRINAFSSVSVSLGFSASPLFIDYLIMNFGWQGAWQVMALGLVVVLILVVLFFKDIQKSMAYFRMAIRFRRKVNNILCKVKLPSHSLKLLKHEASGCIQWHYLFMLFLSRA